MEVNCKYDEIFLNILKEEGQIIPFLDAVFGFLFRKTDFYYVQEHGDEKIGFPPGMAERIVHTVFKKWEQPVYPTVDDPSIPIDIVAEEVTVETSAEPAEVVDVISKSSREHREEKPSASDTYNGADCGNYQWSQSITDIDVQSTFAALLQQKFFNVLTEDAAVKQQKYTKTKLVPVKPHVLSSNDVNVDVETSHIKVSTKTEGIGEWDVLIDSDLLHKNFKNESVWSLEPGKHISIHLEKYEERWWEALLTIEKRLDPKSIDASRSISDLGQEEQMKIQELMWNEERKRLGLPTTQQLEAEKIFKKLNIEELPVQSGALNIMPGEELPDT